MNIYAHRGNSGFFPENTLLSFKESLDLDIYGIELDVHKTKDGVIVVNHDETVERNFNGKGYIKKLTFDQIRSLDNNNQEFESNSQCKIPTLEEVLTLIKDTDFVLNIELKNNKVRYKNLEKDVIQMVKDFNMEDRVILSSFNARSLKKCNKIDPSIKTGYLINANTFKRKSFKKILKTCIDYKCTYIHPSVDLVNKEFVEESQKRGLLVQVYTVNSITIMRKLIKLKVDGVFTNYPKIIRSIIED